MGNNSLEVNNIKIFVSLLYYACRIENEQKMHEKYMQEKESRCSERNCCEEGYGKWYNKYERSLIKNWNIRGYFTPNDGIRHLHWRVKLGQNRLSDDDTDCFLSRAYGGELCDSYDRRGHVDNSDVEINVTDSLIQIVNELNEYINGDSACSRKLKSVLRLSYDTLYIYSNIDSSVISIATIFETLLLGKDEDNQRKKVSVRSACLLNDQMDCAYKKYFASYVYFFISIGMLLCMMVKRIWISKKRLLIQ